MKIEIDKRDLLSLIGKTQNIVEKRNTMPILINVLLEADQNLLKVFATDLEVSLTDQIKAQVHQPGKVAVSAKSLFEIAKELSEGPITLIKKENNWLEIKQGKYTSKIVGISAEEYPIFPTYNSQAFIKIDAQVLKEMIDKTIYSVSNDETRYHLNGVFFELNPQAGFKMVATDGHRMSLVSKTSSDVKVSATQGVIIPRKGLHEIKKILEGIDGSVEIAVEGSQFVLKHSSTILMIRLIEGKYPNYQQFIPQKLTQKVMINKEAFLTSLKRVSLLANQKSKAVLLNLSNGRMEISSNNPELGDAKEEIEVEYAGGDIKIGFNAKYITDILTSMNHDKIDFELNDHLSPGLMRPHNDASYTCVVMPMRI
ncbi:DNA polymerase III subunit beta [Bdellovibrio sp. SKB1291214]|uniref:DNA polymerase III subunit beta n=1 Tax=Bdellovibrio sp. SKB1291214 TaxID=1732569 RepID=UPI000B51C1E1|nr:DNA polymerase III subunit beta [Bdellovibrio sp. SKB1291214]UYL10550.1 DNA polymerase III subunit beta [Bdellovibrio sp. SKB1291214]